MRAGSLFSGAGLLDLAVECVFGARTVWVSDIEPGPRKVLAHRFPGAPNLGDITAVDWSQVEPVDIIAGGSPCTDISSAGRMAGMYEGTRSNLWACMRDAIATLRPRYVVWENVYAARSTKASSKSLPGHIDRAIDHHLRVSQESLHAPTKAKHRRAANRLMESRARLVGVAYPYLVLRALGRVLGDLASLGFDAEWHSLRAADVGAPHGRARYFVVAAHPARVGHERCWPARIGGSGPADGGFGPVALLPTPTTQDAANTSGPSQLDRNSLPLNTVVTLLPTPRATRGGSSTETVALLPTPSVADALGGHERRGGKRSNELLLKGIASHQAWGKYAAAVARWEAVVGPAPAPTKPGRTGRPKLNPAFAEWMMGAPPGWITDVPGVTDNEALRMAGNGVVRQQAVAALRLMLNRAESAV